MKQLPKTIYVRKEIADDNSKWLVADIVPDGDDGELIGIYELRSVGKVRQHPATLEPIKSKKR